MITFKNESTGIKVGDEIGCWIGSTFARAKIIEALSHIGKYKINHNGVIVQISEDDIWITKFRSE